MSPNRLRIRAWAWLAAALLATPTAARATTLRASPNLVDLLQDSELIVHGRVKSVVDGIDARGIPYTEVTLHVAQALKGQPGAEYTFRQFGLLAPRKLPDGRVNLMVTPAAWTTYARGDEAIYFLRRAASRTGLRTTSGLAHGRFLVTPAGVANSVDNSGLFRGVAVDAGLLGDAEKRVMATTRGAVNTSTFTTLVKRAVDGRWVENRRMRHADR